MSKATIGDVVQIAPEADVNVGLRTCFAVVTEVKGWGVLADVAMPGKGVAPVRLAFGQFERIGPAAWGTA